MYVVAFLTVGDVKRRTGGYLYHREVFARLRAAGHVIDEYSLCAADPGSQQVAAQLVAPFDPLGYDVIAVDALARIVVAPRLDQWRALRPLVAMIHELPSAAGDDSPQQRAWEAPLLRAHRLISVSDDGAAALVARGVDPARIAVASGGFDRVSQVEHGPGEPIAGVRVLSVAQWIPRKGLLALARAWAAVAQPGDQLELIGEKHADPAYTAAVYAALAAAPPGSVMVHGPVDDAALAAAYARADLFALPSRFEGYGLVYAEALAYGLPILACAIGPLPALIGPEAGILTPPGDQTALNAGLRRLLTDPALRRHMANAARRRAATLPTWGDTAAGFLRALEEAVQECRMQYSDE